MALRRPQNPALRRAFTLVEVVLVAMLIGILAAIVIPRFSGTLARQRVEAAATRIVHDLELARRQARIASASRQVIFDAGTGTYRLPGITHLDQPGAEYTVDLAAEPYGVRMSLVDFGGDGTLVYDGYGSPDSGGSVRVGGIGYRAVVTVDAETGRARISELAGNMQVITVEPVEEVVGEVEVVK